MKDCSPTWLWYVLQVEMVVSLAAQAEFRVWGKTQKKEKISILTLPQDPIQQVVRWLCHCKEKGLLCRKRMKMFIAPISVACWLKVQGFWGLTVPSYVATVPTQSYGQTASAAKKRFLWEGVAEEPLHRSFLLWSDVFSHESLRISIPQDGPLLQAFSRKPPLHGRPRHAATEQKTRSESHLCM